MFISSERFLSLGYVSYNALQDFHAFFEEAGDNTGPKTIEDKLFEAEVRRRLLRIVTNTIDGRRIRLLVCSDSKALAVAFNSEATAECLRDSQRH